MLCGDVHKARRPPSKHVGAMRLKVPRTMPFDPTQAEKPRRTPPFEARGLDVTNEFAPPIHNTQTGNCLSWVERRFYGEWVSRRHAHACNQRACLGATAGFAVSKTSDFVSPKRHAPQLAPIAQPRDGVATTGLGPDAAARRKATALAWRKATAQILSKPTSVPISTLTARDSNKRASSPPLRSGLRTMHVLCVFTPHTRSRCSMILVVNAPRICGAQNH